MNTPVSNVSIAAFDNFISGKLPPSLVISATRRQQCIISALTKIHALYVNNGKGIYVDTEQITFYNAAQNDFLNIRDLTRWTGISGANLPEGFRASKLLSCNLKEANPDLVEYPPGVAYIQDLPIQIAKAEDANTAVPAANSGYCALVETNRLITVLTLGDPNSWTNLATITAILAFYRPPILPAYTGGASPENQFIDILIKDFDLASNYIMQELFGNSTPFKTLREIENAENAIIYNF